MTKLTIILCTITLLFLAYHVYAQQHETPEPLIVYQEKIMPLETIVERVAYVPSKTPYITVSATAYCPCEACSEGWGTQTATGATATQGRTMAVDPLVIPYGAECYVEGIGLLVAEDCGGAINGNEIDVYFDSHADVDKFGRKQLKLWVLEG